LLCFALVDLEKPVKNYTRLAPLLVDEISIGVVSLFGVIS